MEWSISYWWSPHTQSMIEKHIKTHRKKFQTCQLKVTHSSGNKTDCLGCKMPKLSFWKCLFLYVYLFVLPVCMSVHHVCAWCLQRPGEGIRSSGTGFTDGCGSPCRCWESNLGSLQEQPVRHCKWSRSGLTQQWHTCGLRSQRRVTGRSVLSLFSSHSDRNGEESGDQWLGQCPGNSYRVPLISLYTWVSLWWPSRV